MSGFVLTPEQSLETLRNSLKVLHQTELIGQQICETLVTDTETLKHAHDQAQMTNHNLRQSTSILKRMKSWWRG